MINALSVFTCSVTLFVSLLLPPLFLVAYALKNRKQGIVSAWLLGAVGFFVPQILIRLPLLNMLSTREGFVAFSQNHLLLYGLALAFTAGLFELAGRYAVALLLRKRLTCRRALAAGLGHGGIEAMLVIGIAYISNLVLMVLIRSGRFDVLASQLAGSGMDISNLKEVLVSTPAAMYLLASLERLLTMTCHAAMSMLVCYGVRTGRTVRCLLICLAVHTFIDATASISFFIGRGLSQAAAYTVIYLLLAAVSVVSLLTIRALCRRWPEECPQGETV